MGDHHLQGHRLHQYLYPHTEQKVLWYYYDLHDVLPSGLLYYIWINTFMPKY